MNPILKWIAIIFVIGLAGSLVYSIRANSKSKKNVLELTSVIDSLNTRITNDSIIVESLKNVNDQCSRSALETVKYYDARMKNIYLSIDKNRQIINELEKKKQQIISKDMSNKELIDYINKNY
ncbi:MAG: hypothetical protein WAT79_08630 [Saprospiraceae bacterium]